MIRFRDKRFLAVAIVVAALVVFVLPAFVAFRYTAPEQRGQFLTSPWRGWSFAYAALAVPGQRRAQDLRHGAAQGRLGVQGDGRRPPGGAAAVRQAQAAVHVHASHRRPHPHHARCVPTYRFIWQVQGVVDTISQNSDTLVALLDYKSGRVLYDVRDDLTPAELAPQPGDTATPSPAP